VKLVIHGWWKSCKKEPRIQLQDIELLPVLDHNNVSLVQQPPYLCENIGILALYGLLACDLLPHNFGLEQPLGRPAHYAVILGDVVRGDVVVVFQVFLSRSDD